MSYNLDYVIPSIKKRIEKAQEREKSNLKVIQTDFMENLPDYIRRAVDEAKWAWKSYPWFEEAWNKYRDHVIQAVENGSKIKGPGFIFNDYIDEQVEKDITEEEVLNVMHSNLDIDELEHGVKTKVTERVINGGILGNGAERIVEKSHRSKSVASVEKDIKKGEMIFKSVITAGIITAITVGALRRRAKRKNAEIAREEHKKDSKSLRKEAVKDAKTQLKINKILASPTSGNYNGPERYPAGTPGGLGGQFKPKNA